MSLFRLALAASAAMLTVSTAASAASIMYASTPTTTASVATNFGPGLTRQVSLSLPTFDTTMGGTGTATLTGVSLSLTGTINAILRFENLDTDPALITATAAATIGLNRPTGGSLVVVLPTQSTSVQEGAFDNAVDYAGTSGSTLSGITATLTNTSSLASSDFAAFSSVGAGTIALPVSGTGASSESGAGNLSAFNSTFAQAGATVVYTFNFVPNPPPPPTTVPEPASMALIGAGLAGLGLARRRKA